MLLLLFAIAIVALIILRLFVIDKIIIDMSDKAVLVTGCGSGFGRAFVLNCLKNNITVFASCRALQDVESLQKEYSKDGTIIPLQMDVTSDESVQNAKRLIEEKLKQLNKRLYAIVNNAAIAGHSLCDDVLQLQDYKNTMEVNAYGVIRVIKAFKQMIKHNKGRIITITSSGVRFPLPCTGPYIFSKCAIDGYLEILRYELFPFGVKVITIEPGRYQTPMNNMLKVMKSVNEIWANADPEIKKEYGEYWFSFGKHIYVKIFTSAPKDLTPVADAYLHAVRAKFPYRNYCIGFDAVFIQRPISWLPARLKELIMQIIQWMLDIPLPDALDS